MTEHASKTPDERFEGFWTSYPRKVGKPRAKVSFKAMLKRGDVDACRNGLALWKRYWFESATLEVHIPHPATWLNDRRYNDTPPPAVAGLVWPPAARFGKDHI